jgi:ATP-binding cassette subfamily B protein
MALGTVGSGALPVAVAWLTKSIIDSLARSRSAASDVLPAALALVIATVVVSVLPRSIQYLRAQSDRVVSVLAQDRMFSAVDRFHGLSRFEDPVFLDHLRLAQQSSGSTPGMVVSSVLESAKGIVTASGFLGSLVLLNPVMAAVVLGAAIPMFVAQLSLSRQRAAMTWGISPIQRREFFYARLLSSVEAAKEIRLFGAGAFLRSRMLAERAAANRQLRRMDRRELRVNGGLALLSAIISGGGLLWAVELASTATIGIGDVTMFIAAVAGVQGAVASVVSSAASAHQQLLLFGHYLAVTRAEPDLSVPAVAGTLPALRGGIELRDVWFRYSDDHPWVLRGVNMFIPYGRAIALVGRNGCGKSTLVKLLCRFYDPVRGTIRWDGVDIRTIPVEDLRAAITAVFQDFMHYDMTAAENIGLGEVAAIPDRTRIERAGALTGIHETLTALPRGYQTLLTRMFTSEADKQDPETGVVLSGGQWQRIALARAMLRERRDLLILDEPSSGLDAVAEHEVHTRLRDYRAGQTSVLISHRLGAVRDADGIVVLAAGQVVEHGTHDELVARGGEYATLFRLQASGYQPAERPEPILTAERRP